MIVLGLIALAIYLGKLERHAWGLVLQAKRHEAVGDPNKHGHAEAMAWVTETTARAETYKQRGAAVEAMAALLGRWVLAVLCGLAVLRIAADAFRAAAGAVSDEAGLAGWQVVVDGIDVLMWIAVGV